MKKLMFTMILAAAAMNINAQLVVDSLGRIGIGTEAPKSLLSVGNKGNSHTSIYCSSDKKYGLKINNYNEENNYTTYGADIQTENLIGDCYGIYSQAIGDYDPSSSQYVIGLNAFAGNAHTAVGVYGGKYVMTSPLVNFAGVYGADWGVSPTFTYSGANYSGSYAGFFQGKVRVTDGIYATVLSPATSPSPSGQGSTTILSDRGESVTDKLSRVQTLQYLRYNPETETGTVREDAEDLDSLSETMEGEGPEPCLSAIQYGLAADQLKAVYPELVYEDANGNVSINYVEMVPLLVQSINELKSELAELKGTSAREAKAKSETTAIEENVSDIDMVRMDQNKPNPFSESTVIALNIPEQAQTAKIFIYDMSGKQVQSIAVSERGETNITVYASELTAGMYIYTLVVDGKAAVTRRMIVSKG